MNIVRRIKVEMRVAEAIREDHAMMREPESARQAFAERRAAQGLWTREMAVDWLKHSGQQTDADRQGRR